jgi:serine/threonine-protein kinase
MASFVHPNLAMIFGLETWRGVPILVVEFLPGGSLSQRVSRANDPLFAVDLGRKLAGAVAALHQKGMLHRDIKPANIGFSEDVEPKLLDFGLAQIIEESRVELDQNFALSVGSTGDRHDGRLTRTDQVVGTPLYLSPEVLRGGQPSPDQDLWSLHLVLWETVAGRHPLEGLPKDDALDLLLGARIPSIRNERPDCPKELAELLDRGLSRSMAARPASARGLQADLEKIAIGLRQ